MNDAVRDGQIVNGCLCGNTNRAGQPNAHLSFINLNMAFHLKDVCSSNFTWPLNMMLTREMCAIEVFVWRVEARLLAGQAPGAHLLLKSPSFLGS